MPIIRLEAENIIERIHRGAMISYRDIIKKMNAYKDQYPSSEMSDVEAAYLVADEKGVEIDFDAETQLRKIKDDRKRWNKEEK